MSKLRKRYNGEIDNYDLGILKELQVNSHQSLQSIGEKVNLSAPAVQRRIKRLEKEKIIERNISVLNRETLGLSLTVLVTVNMVSERLDLYNKTKNMFKKCHNIQQCYHVVGKSDFVLIIIVSDMEEFDILAKELFFENKNVKNFTSYVVVENVKVGLSLPF